MPTHDEIMKTAYPEGHTIYKETKWEQSCLLDRMKLNKRAKMFCQAIAVQVRRGNKIAAQRLAQQWLDMLTTTKRVCELKDRIIQEYEAIENCKDRVTKLQADITEYERWIVRNKEELRRIEKYNSENLGLENKEPLAIWYNVWEAEQRSNMNFSREDYNEDFSEATHLPLGKTFEQELEEECVPNPHTPRPIHRGREEGYDNVFHIPNYSYPHNRMSTLLNEQDRDTDRANDNAGN